VRIVPTSITLSCERVTRFDNGAIATAEASFNAVYGYDIRWEVFGSAGTATAGDIRRTTMTYYGPEALMRRHNSGIGQLDPSTRRRR
jgi:predicted dehydrogenase